MHACVRRGKAEWRRCGWVRCVETGICGTAEGLDGGGAGELRVVCGVCVVLILGIPPL